MAIVLAALGLGCVATSQQPPALQVAAVTAAPSPMTPGPRARRIVYDGEGRFTLPDGTKVEANDEGGFTLPNGTYVRPDGSGGVVLPNGGRCQSDGARGYVCP